MPLSRLILSLALGAPAAVALGEPTVIEQRLWEGVESIQAGGEPNYQVRDQGNGLTDRWTTGVTDPVLTIYRPGNPSGAACLIFPGGGYGGLSLDKEGHFVARWLAERGVVGVVVPYRCGGGKHRHPVPLMDAQRAMRVVRAKADELAIDKNKIGVMGFSAGGHLAASVATHSGTPYLLAEDPLGKVSARADFAALIYPVISMRQEITHGGSRNNLLGPQASDELVAELSADERVDTDTPPTLLIHSNNDTVVPVANPQRYYDACLKHQVPVEMHLYETGGHGYGMWADSGTVAGWPAVLEDWLTARGLVTKD